MKFIDDKTEGGQIKGKIASYCRVLDVSRQGFYEYLHSKDKPYKYAALVEAINLNYSCTSGTASANGCALSDINITDTLQRFPPKKGALLPWVIVFL